MSTLLYIKPDHDVVLAILIPMERGDTENVKNLILNQLYEPMEESVINTPLERCNDRMQSSNNRFVGVYKKTNETIIIRRGLNSSNFNKEYNFLKNNGYHPTDIDAYKNDDGINVWDGIFKQGNPNDYKMWRNFNKQEFHDKWLEMANLGYKLFDIETYTGENNQRLWAGLFIKQEGNYVLKRDISTSTFESFAEQYANQGFKLIDVEVYKAGNQIKWAGVWLSGEKSIYESEYSMTSLTNYQTNYLSSGYTLIDIEFYFDENGNRKWVAVWEKNASLSGRLSDRLNYCQYMMNHDSWQWANYELIDLEQY